MIQTKLFICADSAATDGRYNTVSAFHILEQLNATAFPFAIPRISMIAMFTRENEDPSTFQLQLQIDSGDQRLFDGPMPVNFQQQLSARTVLDMHALVVPSPGALTFTLRNGEAPIGSWTVLIVNAGRPNLQPNLPIPLAPQA